MSALLDRLIHRSIALEVALLAARARLQARTDGEALHDLRVAVRRLRSLLRPLRGVPGVETLEALSGAFGRQSGPLRDVEVLAEELQRRGLEALAVQRRGTLEAGYDELLAAPELARLRQALGLWPGLLREAEREGALRGLGKRLQRRLQRQVLRLREGLADPAHDRHRLRILVKRVRYAAEAWPRQLQVQGEGLKLAQAALGDWHDRWQWCQRAAVDAALAPCLAQWQTELEQAALAADAALAQLQRDLDGASD